MKIYDISQEMFSSAVYPGDPVPVKTPFCEINKGSFYNLTSLSLSTHNGTHIDAPYHFYTDGKTIDQIALEKCIGPCSVVNMSGVIGRAEMLPILQKSKKKLLIRGVIELTLEAAKAMNESALDLIGVEGLTVGPFDAPMPVHLELLGKEVVILEGLVLQDVPEGEYILSAVPLKLGDCDGAPCRAVLMEY